MRPKSLILIIIAGGCGLVASIGISQVIERRGQSTGEPVKTEDIFVSIVDIPIGEPLTPQMIKLEPWPKDRIPVGAISRLEEIKGRRPKQPLYAGEPILHAKLIDQDGRGGASEKIPKGYRVLSVKVTADSAASGLILPGDRVDVMVYLTAGQGIASPMAKTILTDVTVFAVNEQINRQVDGDGTMIHAKTVSLLVKPDQAEKLMLATQLGRLHLSLRRADDETANDSAGASLQDLHVTEDATQEIATAEAGDGDDSLLTLLQSMKGQDATSSLAPAVPLRTMEVYSPEGVSTYTWDDPTKLPRELSQADVGGFAGAYVPPQGSAGFDPGQKGSGDGDPPTEKDQGDIEVDQGDFPSAEGDLLDDDLGSAD
jgi:pilus assembly protein CpaB